MASRPDHLFLTVELPSFYVDDIAELREFSSPEATESEHILNCIGEPSGVRLTTEVSGEKDSDVISVYGMVDSAEVREASRGYGGGAHLTEDEVEEEWADRLEGDSDGLLRAAVNRLRELGVSDGDLADDLRWQLDLVERKMATK